MALRPCVVIPAYNAAKTIGWLVREVAQQGLDTIVVNDGSKDQTAKKAAEAGAMVISHVHNRGKGTALRTGFAFAFKQGYDAVVTLDGDGQHDPCEINRLLDAAQHPEAIVVGNRLLNGKAMPIARRWTNRLMSVIVSWLTRQRIPDSQCGFRVIPRGVLAALQLSSERFDLETELLLAATRRGFSVRSVPIRTIYNNHSSHIRPLADGLRFVRLALRYLLRLDSH